MKKVILYQLNQLGYGGTEKAIYTFIKNLNKDKYIVKIFFYTDIGSFNYYRRKALSFLGGKYFKNFNQKYNINFARKEDFEKLVGIDNFYMGTKEKFLNICNNTKLDIIHFNRGGHEDFYTKIINKIPINIKIYETNIFGKNSNKEYLTRLNSIYFVSKWLLSQSKWSKDYNNNVLYNPICLPKGNKTFRKQYNISNNKVILGRISRPNLDDGEFIINTLDKVLNDNTIFMVIGATNKFKKATKNNEKIICIEPTTDESVLSMFYNTLDILLHYRKEGETFGMNIAEAMIHGKPVISHYSSEDNAQAELLLEERTSGIIVEENNIEEYIDAINKLINDNKLRLEYGQNAKIKANTFYSEKIVVKQLESYYDTILETKD